MVVKEDDEMIVTIEEDGMTIETIDVQEAVVVLHLEDVLIEAVTVAEEEVRSQPFFLLYSVLFAHQLTFYFLLDRGRGRYRSRSRSNSPGRYRRRHSSDSRSPPPSRKRQEDQPMKEKEQSGAEGEGEEEEEDDEETKMMKLMGFGGFDTTKNKKVPGADVSAAKIRRPIKYRQYMNRRGGFNRFVTWLYWKKTDWFINHFLFYRPLDN